MTSKEFIINKLNELVEIFPGITFKYKYDNVEKTHMIEVSPLAEFKNIEYMIAEADLVFEFENNFIPETLLFVSEDSLTKVNRPDLVIKSNNLGLFMNSLIYEPRMTFNFTQDFINLDSEYYALAA